VEPYSFELLSDDLEYIKDIPAYRSITAELEAEIQQVLAQPPGEKDLSRFLPLVSRLEARLVASQRWYPLPKPDSQRPPAVSRRGHSCMPPTVADLLPGESPGDPEAVSREQAGKLFETLLKTADAQTFSLLNLFLALLVETAGKRV
jgi:hypothetical protein